MKMVIYKSGNKMEVTTEANYNSRIKDARKIQDCSDFDNPMEVIEYFVKWFGSKAEDFIVKC